VVFFLLLSFVGIRGIQINMTGTPDDARGGIVAGVESAVAALRAQQQELRGVDTTSMDDPARAVVREELAEVTAALEALSSVGLTADSAAAAGVSDSAVVATDTSATDSDSAAVATDTSAAGAADGIPAP